MIAIEIAKYYPLATVILVSSLLNRDQRQLWMKIGRILHLERWLSQNYSPRNQGLRRLIAWVEDFYMGVENDWDGALVKSYRNRTDFRYLRWAIGQILHWDNRWIPTTVYQLHGGRDRIFRLPSAAVTHYIPDGGHLMIHNRPELVNPIIAGILEKQA